MSSYNKFVISRETRENLKSVKLPSDLDQICEDLKVCGRREFSELLKLKYKYSLSKLPVEEKKDVEEKEMTPE